MNEQVKEHTALRSFHRAFWYCIDLPIFVLGLIISRIMIIFFNIKYSFLINFLCIVIYIIRRIYLKVKKVDALEYSTSVLSNILRIAVLLSIIFPMTISVIKNQMPYELNIVNFYNKYETPEHSLEKIVPKKRQKEYENFTYKFHDNYDWDVHDRTTEYLHLSFKAPKEKIKDFKNQAEKECIEKSDLRECDEINEAQKYSGDYNKIYSNSLWTDEYKEDADIYIYKKISYKGDIDWQTSFVIINEKYGIIEFVDSEYTKD